LDRAVGILSEMGISTKVRYTKPAKTTDNYNTARIVQYYSTEKNCVTLVVAFFPEKEC